MTTIVRPHSTAADEVLKRVRRLAPQITSRASEVESARRLPPDLLHDLVAAGLFRLLLPPSHDGLGADLLAAVRVFEELARADASVAWSVMIGSTSWRDLAELPRSMFDALYADGPDVIIGGAFNPTGSAAAVDGGYRVSGRWAFASGCEHSHWLFGNCIEEVEGGGRLRTALFSPAEVVIEDTWNVAGLRGTGSHHFRADNVLVPAERTFLPFEDAPCLDTAIVRIPPPALFALEIPAVAIGAAQGALDDIAALAADTVPLLASTSLAANPLFQFRFATADTELRAARALLYEVAEETWATAVDGSRFEPGQRARIRAAATWATSRSVAVVDTAYEAAGGRALYADSPLQRRLRDVHAMTQHFLVRPDVLTTAGAVLAGQDVDLTVF